MGSDDGSSIPKVFPHVAHSWLKKKNISYVPGDDRTFLLDEFARELLRHFREHGNGTPLIPGAGTDVILTTVPFGIPLDWRESLGITARMRFGLERAPTVYTLIHIRPDQYRAMMDHFEKALAKPLPDPEDYAFAGLVPQAYLTLHEQGQRGGPALAFQRMLQAQTKCIRIILVVGHDHPVEAYLYDLVGAHPRIDAQDVEAFYKDVMLRILTAASTTEITAHQISGDPIPHTVWKSLLTPPAMCRAGHEFGKRHFFTEMVRVGNLVNIPAINDAVASQYSEGCFATWDPHLRSLIATVTGSARPVEKDNLTDDELTIIVGIRPDGKGALIRDVVGKRNDPPSSEAVELMGMDAPLPRVILGPEWGITTEVPVVRSKLHGHRGVKYYDPGWVEHTRLDTPYYHYPVSCGTDAQAQAIRSAFGRAEALNSPRDPRQVVFTILPGHGVVIVEKWVPGKVPFQVIWETIDAGFLEIDNLVPQGPLAYIPDASGLMVLSED